MKTEVSFVFISVLPQTTSIDCKLIPRPQSGGFTLEVHAVLLDNAIGATMSEPHT